MPMPSFALTSRISSGIGADQIVHFLLAPLRLGAGQVDLVEDRDDLEPGVHREEEIRQRLRLDPLRRVDDEDRALARGERARDLVGEVDVPRRVDEVELVLAAVLGVDALEAAYPDFDAAVLKVAVSYGELTLYIRPDHVARVAQTMRDNANLRFELLSSISGVDYLGTSTALHAVYHLTSLTSAAGCGRGRA